MDNDSLPFLIAQLIDHFHITPREIGQLTRRQIHTLYLWKRDEHGGLVPPVLEAKKQSNITREQMIQILKKSGLRIKDEPSTK